MCMEKIATDTYSFSDIRNGNFVYVDKTAILKTLADGSLGKQFFIARPRRFGKSLAISTLQCLFEGRRELFKGLAIEPAWDWSKTYPVLKLDMGSCQAASVKDLWRKIDTMLKAESERLGVPLRTYEPSSGECCECPSRSDGPPVGTGIEAIVVLTGGPSLRDGRHPQVYRPVG